MTSNYSVSVSGISIDVTVTDSASAVNEWVKYVRVVYGSSRIIVGLDIKKKQHYGDGISTLQLCVGINCLIFQLYHSDYTHQSLKTFFNDSNVIFVGQQVDHTYAENLRHRYGLTCTNLVDIVELAKRRYPELKVWTLDSLAEKFAGLTIPVERMDLFHSDWEARELSLEQIEYACSHAYASFRIGQAIIQ